MSGFFGCVSRKDCVADVFYGTDYHSHLGTKRAGLAFYNGRIKSSIEKQEKSEIIVWRVPISGINLNRNWIVLPGLTWGSG